jgi:two-component system chemotaxis response regulator CheB
LYDGAAGLLALTAHGGSAIVQDPEEATMPSMPQSALAMVRAARVLPASEIGREIERSVNVPVALQGGAHVADDEEQIAVAIRRDFAEQAADEREEAVTVHTCPDCGGVRWQANTGPAGWFRCHVGHAYAPEVLLIQKTEEVEAALWACVRLLREKATMTRQMAARSLSGGKRELAERIGEQARLDEEHARVIRELLEVAPTSSEQSPDVFLDSESRARPH